MERFDFNTVTDLSEREGKQRVKTNEGGYDISQMRNGHRKHSTMVRFH